MVGWIIGFWAIQEGRITVYGDTFLSTSDKTYTWREEPFAFIFHVMGHYLEILVVTLFWLLFSGGYVYVYHRDLQRNRPSKGKEALKGERAEQTDTDYPETHIVLPLTSNSKSTNPMTPLAMPVFRSNPIRQKQ
jgi:hypothetical protein